MRLLPLFLLSIAFNSQVNATPTWPANNLASGELLQSISVIGSEDRKTFEAYAAEKGLSLAAVEKKFAATGVINCAGKEAATAQLTESTAVITTAAHIFLEKKSGGRCKEIPIEKCTFYTYKNGWTVEHPVDNSSLKMSGCGVDDKKYDWAVVKLKSPVRGVKPYRIPPNQVQPRVGDRIISPAAFSANFKPNGQFARSVTECSVRDFQFHMQTDCDAGGGASGSAQLLEQDGNLFLMSILTGSMANQDGQSYDSVSNYNTSSVLEGDFYEAVRDAVGKPAKTASAKDKRDKGI